MERRHGIRFMVIPFIGLYEAQAELDVGKIKGNIFEPTKE